jgi:hypothetical protein
VAKVSRAGMNLQPNNSVRVRLIQQ